MDLNYLRKVVKIFDECGATELNVEEEGLKIKLSKNSREKNSYFSGYSNPAPVPLNTQQANVSVSDVVVKSEPAPIATEHVPATHTSHTINSPIVGTFYRASSPDANPYVEIGSHVNKGDTLCIIEAMKLLNEIESDVSGTIDKILVENSQPVEFSQPLFHIKPD
ncbi:MAG: acetyl-CoA carboxylase biotin carboxyl carrier protein [Candidatus Kapabacteria bacterium]|nr:acetyl-CoA carboxylase biotin carboxyl carrier protein [Candidatus Kapabacteria bacterium]